MGLSTHQAGERQLPLTVPLEQIDLGDAQRLTRTAVPGDDVQCEIVPRGRSAGGHDPPGGIRDDQVWFRVEANGRKARAE